MNREQWDSRWGFVLATVGSAIGLGNIWRFPTAVGQSGGGAFLVLYLVIILFIGVPLMICELSIGRRGNTNIVDSFGKIKKGSYWWLAGLLGIITGFVILSFYSVIAGWSLNYIFKFVGGQFSNPTAEQAELIFEQFISRPLTPLLWQAIFVALTISIVTLGIKGGIEKFSKTLMPFMFFLLFLLAARSMTLEGAGEGITWYLRPDFSLLNIDIILGALGQVFFSLSLGMGSIITYGSYLKKENNLPRSSLIISITDLAIAITAGLIIIPAVFAFGLSPQSGPPLIFITLPLVFGALPLGNVLGALFFLLLSIAAITSSISIMEVIVAYFIDKFEKPRKTVSMVTGVVIFLIGIPSSLSRGPLQDFLVFNLPFLELMDYISAHLLLPLAGLLIAVFVGWIWTPDSAVKEINLSANKFRLARPWAVIVKYLLPIILTYILISGLIS